MLTFPRIVEVICPLVVDSDNAVLYYYSQAPNDTSSVIKNLQSHPSSQLWSD